MNIGDFNRLCKEKDFKPSQEIQILDKDGNLNPANIVNGLGGRYSPIILGVSKVCRMCGESFVVSAVGNPNLCKECGEHGES